MNIIERFIKKRAARPVEDARVSKAVTRIAEVADGLRLTGVEFALALGCLQQIVLDETGACAVSDGVLEKAADALSEDEGE